VTQIDSLSDIRTKSVEEYSSTFITENSLLQRVSHFAQELSPLCKAKKNLSSGSKFLILEPRGVAISI